MIDLKGLQIRTIGETELEDTKHIRRIRHCVAEDGQARIDTAAEELYAVFTKQAGRG